MALQEMQLFNSQAEAKRSLTSAIESVAGRLGNTPAICRKCYIHPAVFDAFLDRSLVDSLRQRADQALASKAATPRLSREEAAVLGLLRARLAHMPRPTRPHELTETLRRAVASA